MNLVTQQLLEVEFIRKAENNIFETTRGGLQEYFVTNNEQVFENIMWIYS